ncbi:hypothetical protein AMJ87_03885 [candidate division WOR_3 bacterium SM23_60]|uniref:Orc1-like AAA ATPase domain-containing protein n=1 Tax=candidate division WOR_3 bacterium SM23_60 TaxID=1703780 RepID=A0A0S8GI59_UNCW3|nr:MAG: hypothetical protein AMJ87_03885 [candidate division WOR_3 bacterium SM23_60]
MAFLSIFVRSLAPEHFFDITDTLERFSCHTSHTEKDLITVECDSVDIIACLQDMKKTYSETRFGFSQYPGLATGLAKIAQFGEILVSEDIQKKILDTYDITSLGMLSIEGMSSQILVYRVDAPRGELRYPEQKKTAFVIQRGNEIESLNNLLRVANAILVYGNVGIGKTTLLDQALATWQEKESARTFCPSYSSVAALKPITDIVTQILGVYGITSIEEKQKTIEKKLKDLDIKDIGTSYLAVLDFLGLSEEESILEKLELKTKVDIITESVADVVKRVSWNRPVVIVIEDAENMDASSFTFVQRLTEKLAEENVCFIFSSTMPKINISGLKEFELRHIDKKQLENLIERVTGEHVTLIPTTPFHVLQYLALYEEERINFLYKQYRGNATVSEFSLPFHDLTTIIKRRIELLNEEKKKSLFDLVIAGVEFRLDDVPIEPEHVPLLDYFVKHEYLRKHFNTYMFTSPLLHKEIYNLIPDKKIRHERLADYYRRLEGFEEQAAFHYLRAENHRKALDLLRSSAALAIKRGGYESGIHYYNQALDLCQHHKEIADLEILVALNEGLADVYRALGDEERALKYYKFVLDSYKDILSE